MEEEFQGEPILGGYEFEFVDYLSPGQSCPICLLAMRSPVQTVCGHRFCESCLLETFRYCIMCSVCVSKQTILNCSCALKFSVRGLYASCRIHVWCYTYQPPVNFLIHIPSGEIMILQFVQKIGILFLKMEGWVDYIPTDLGYPIMFNFQYLLDCLSVLN